MIVTHYTLAMQGLRRALRVAVVADLHDSAPEELHTQLAIAQPQLVLLPGDYLDGPGHTENGLGFLRVCAARYPTLCSLGNHEVKAGIPDLEAAIAQTGAELLADRCVFRQGIWIGGLSTGWALDQQQSHRRPTPPPNREFIRHFAALDGPRLLLCHHPEYYRPYLAETSIPLVVSGHAHGGQWQLLGRGIYAPGQGLLPAYTAGLYDGRLLVSRGLCATRRWIPRIGNPRELVILDLWPQEKQNNA